MNADEAHQQELEHRQFEEYFESIFPYHKTMKELAKLADKLEALNERQKGRFNVR